MSMIPSCAGMDPRGRGGPPMGMAQPGRGGGRGPGATVEGDRWGKRALPPPPPGTGGPAMSNLPALHKTDNKFKVGCVPPFLLLLLLRPALLSLLAMQKQASYARSRLSCFSEMIYKYVRMLAQTRCIQFIHATSKALH